MFTVQSEQIIVQKNAALPPSLTQQQLNYCCQQGNAPSCAVKHNYDKTNAERNNNKVLSKQPAF